jgi:hypothetical protein
MEACIPQLVLKARKNLPWLTKSVIQAMRRRNSLFRAAKRSKDDHLNRLGDIVLVTSVHVCEDEYFVCTQC